nr:hypothetical protein [Tanacetum cinerariifolium]
YKEYLENSSDVIATVLPTEEPDYSLSIGYEHLSTIPEMKSDEVIESSVKNLVQIPVIAIVLPTEEPDYSLSMGYEHLSTIPEMKSDEFDYLEEFSGELMPASIINEERIKREHAEYMSLMEKLLTINSFPRPLENFHANTIIETLPTSPIPVGDRELISAVMNNIDELNEDECFDLGGGIESS